MTPTGLEPVSRP